MQIRDGFARGSYQVTVHGQTLKGFGSGREGRAGMENHGWGRRSERDRTVGSMRQTGIGWV